MTVEAMEESYPITEVTVHDGDTVHCRARMHKIIAVPVEMATSILGIRVELEKAEIVLHGSVPLAVRISGVDTPEIRGSQKAAGLVVKDLVARWFARYRNAELVFTCRDKYAGRTVGDFRVPGTNHTLSHYLLSHGLAKPYSGGRKQKWTRAELQAIMEKA